MRGKSRRKETNKNEKQQVITNEKHNNKMLFQLILC